MPLPPDVQNIPFQAPVGRATLPASFAAIGLVVAPVDLSTPPPSNLPFTVLEVPFDKNTVEKTAKKTETTSSASLYNGQVHEEFCGGSVGGTFKWESHWRAIAPFYPPELIEGYVYQFLAWIIRPFTVTPPNINTLPLSGNNGSFTAGGVTALQNVWLFNALCDKNMMESDVKTGVTKWSVDFAFTGPKYFYQPFGNQPNVAGPAANSGFF